MASPSADYLAGLYRELAGSTGEHRSAVLAEIERVGGKVPDASPRPTGRPRAAK